MCILSLHAYVTLNCNVKVSEFYVTITVNVIIHSPIPEEQCLLGYYDVRFL